MADNLTRDKRSWNMSRIRSTDTKPEIIVRSLLHHSGYRFSLKLKNLPGKPDIVMPKYKLVIFIHGCYWHRHKGCKNATTPHTRRNWWENKFQENIVRDKRTKKELIKKGWKVIVIWECQVYGQTEKVLKRITRKIGTNKVLNYSTIDKNHILKIAETKHKYILNHKKIS
jgi:DNA mismatch endonuclease, patch repair protein